VSILQLRVTLFLAKDEIYELELQEPLKQLAITKYSMGKNGLAEFDLSANPPVNIGDRIQIEALNPEGVRETIAVSPLVGRGFLPSPGFYLDAALTVHQFHVHSLLIR
jgi:hypothetical protein